MNRLNPYFRTREDDWSGVSSLSYLFASYLFASYLFASNSLKVGPSMLLTLLYTKGCFSDGKPGEQCIICRVRSLWDAVSSQCPGSDGGMCQAGMHQPLDISSTVEQDAGLWPGLFTLLLTPTPHPPLIPPLVIQHSSWLTHLGMDFCASVCISVWESVWGTVDTRQSLDTLGVCRLIGLHAICTDNLLPFQGTAPSSECCLGEMGSP